MFRGVSALALVLAASPGYAQYTFTSFDYPGAAITRLIGINDQLDMVGHFIMPGPGQVRHAMKFSGGVFTALDPDGLLGHTTSAATQINNRGDISGWYSDAPGRRHGYVITKNGVLSVIEYPGSTFSQVNGISDNGVIFGHFVDSVGAFHGYQLLGGVFTTLDYPGAHDTLPFYRNARGDFAGEWAPDPTVIGHAFLLTNHGEWISFDAPNAPPNSSLAIGVNDHRQILGFFQDSAGQRHAFVVDGNDLVPEAFVFIDLPGTGGQPETMNNAGAFVGFYSDATGTHGLLATPRPTK